MYFEISGRYRVDLRTPKNKAKDSIENSIHNPL